MKCNYCLSTVVLVQNNNNVHETTRDTRQRRVIWSLLNTNIHAYMLTKNQIVQHMHGVSMLQVQELLKEINVALPLVIALSLRACKPLLRIHLLEVFCLRITYGRLTLKPQNSAVRSLCTVQKATRVHATYHTISVIIDNT